MKYLILLLLLSSNAFAATPKDIDVRRLSVTCAGGKVMPLPPRSDGRERTAEEKIVDTDAYAATRPCSVYNLVSWVDKNVGYAPVKSSSSGSSSASSKISMSSVSSMSSGSASSIPTLATVNGTCPTTRKNGESLPLSEIAGYDLNCDGRHEKFKQSQCEINYVTSLPLLTKECKLAAYDTHGVYSDYETVVR